MVNYDFKGKVVLVTAASKGIGFAIAQEFYRAGANVAICARNESILDNAVRKIKENNGGKIIGYSTDLKFLSQCELMVDKAESYFSSSIDILINNSGGPPPKKIMDTDDNDWSDAINGNLLSAIFLSKKVLGSMMKKKWGRIVFLTSVLAKEPSEGMALSNVTRSGVASFSKTLSREVANYGITVNTILTGGCKTDRFYSLVQDQIKQTGEALDEAVERLSQAVPVGFISSPIEFAQAVLFIATVEASYINGVSLPLDGGATRSIF